MSCAQVPAGSREFVLVALRLTGGVDPIDPADVEVEAALVRGSEVPDPNAPAPGGPWRPATFDGTTVRTLLTGTEARGRHAVWLRVTSPPERVVRRAGVLVVG